VLINSLDTVKVTHLINENYGRILLTNAHVFFTDTKLKPIK